MIDSNVVYLSAMETILLILDEDKTLRMVRDLLEEAGYRVLTASDSQIGFSLLRRELPNLLVVGLAGWNGWDLIRQVRTDRWLRSTPILMLMEHMEGVDRIVGLELGADDYAVKPYNPYEVLMRVRVLLHRARGGKQPASLRLSIGELTLDLGAHGLKVLGETVALTPTEFKLLHMLMENPGHTYTRQELLKRALGHSFEGAGRTLDTHIRKLRGKVEPNPHRPTYIQTVHRVGYRFAKPAGREDEKIRSHLGGH